MVRSLSALEGAVILCAHQNQRSADQFVGPTPPRQRPHWLSLVVRRRAALRDQTLFGFDVWERLHLLGRGFGFPVGTLVDVRSAIQEFCEAKSFGAFRACAKRGSISWPLRPIEKDSSSGDGSLYVLSDEEEHNGASNW